jgi:small subunit ribosomal protein S1
VSGTLTQAPLNKLSFYARERAFFMKNQTKPENNAMKDLLSSSSSPSKSGHIIDGKVIEVGKKNIFVDLGIFGTGIVLTKEIKESPSLVKQLKMGQEVQCMVLEPENEKGYVEISLRAASKELSWEKLEKIKNSGEATPAKVVQANKGGLMVELLGQLAFLPVSQLSQEHYPRVEGGDKNKIFQQLTKLVGKEISVKIIDLDQRTDKFIVSEKALSREETREMMEHFKPGDVFEGTITAITNFGAFVKLEPKEGFNMAVPDGLIHISELDWGLVRDPREIVKEGEKIKVKIIGFHQGRPTLSLKALKEKPQS